MNIGTLPARHARYRPDHLALATESERLTFRDLDRLISRLGAALQGMGVRKGDKIATVLPNGSAIYATYWAAARIGAATLPLSTLLRGEGLATLLRDSDASAVIADVAFARELAQVRDRLSIAPDRYVFCGGDAGYGRSFEALLAETLSEPVGPEPVISPHDLFNIMYSSGTTGTPKGIVLTYGVRAAYCILFASEWRMTPESVVLHTGSLVFNGAFVTMMPAMYRGATFVLLKQFDPESVMRTIERERVTHTMMVPSQIVALLNAPGFSPERLASLQMLGSVGAPLHLEHREKLVEYLPGRVYELYGLTEGFVTVLDREDFARKRDSVGIPASFADMRIIDSNGSDVAAGVVGEIVGRSPLLMPGYYKRPDLTAQALVDGWLHTGDLGFVDEDGFLHLVDRQKDMIISGGVNVYPRDIEEILVRHPAVKEAAVFGIPHVQWGEAPMAAVIVRAEPASTADELKAWINERVAAKYQRVAQVAIVNDFPRSTAGKTLKRVMRAPYWAGRLEQI
ncbi:MAG: AMP-binding protein [Vicinamibacterales bacterium]